MKTLSKQGLEGQASGVVSRRAAYQSNSRTQLLLESPYPRIDRTKLSKRNESKVNDPEASTVDTPRWIEFTEQVNPCLMSQDHAHLQSPVRKVGLQLHVAKSIATV